MIIHTENQKPKPYKEFCRLGYNAMHSVSEEHVAPIFRIEEWAKQSPACYLFHASFLLDLFFNPEDGDDMFLWNVGWLSTNSSQPPLWEPQILQSLIIEHTSTKFHVNDVWSFLLTVGSPHVESKLEASFATVAELAEVSLRNNLQKL
jgi:hypothetical protein